ncbi:MAG: thioesterase family protein [Clostridia bacterium]|nr:thioesterase family protein [Clostridia bacterium]
MNVGEIFEVTILVTENDTARAFGSGTLEVLATPKMIALMEMASYKSLEKYLENGQSSVGTYLDVKHVSATPVGMKVTAKAEITVVDGRRVEFNVSAYDEKGLIGEGKHERFIVNDEKFVAKTYQKLEK